MLIGRESELRFLEEKYHGPGGQLILLYGRRRVGKTAVLRKFCQGKPHAYYAAAECTDERQLAAFSARLLSREAGTGSAPGFSDWAQAFRHVSELASDGGKRLLIIDEFPLMVKSNGSIPAILERLWEQEWRSAEVMVVLCGSAVSFIEKEFLAEKSPLYGRATGILKMTGIGVFDAARFFPAYSALDKIRAYAVLGGVPHYLERFDGQKSLGENIQTQILAPGSVLYSEVEFLMRQELRETTVYNTILEAVALGNTKLNDIFLKTRIEKSKLTVYLKNLTNLGLIQREFSVSDGMKEEANVQRGLYQITDNFFRFWYAFVFPNASPLEADGAGGVWRSAVGPFLDQYASCAFQDICREYLRRKNRENALPFRFTEIGRWWNKTDEVDIMAANLDQSRFLLGKCKFEDQPLDMWDLTAAVKKFTPKNKSAETYYYLFSKSGFTHEVQNAAGSQIFLISAEDLFASAMD